MSEEIAQRSDEELEAWHREWQADRHRRAMQLRRDARAVFHAMEGWQRITTPEAWQETCDAAGRDYRSGRFLIERLGASRHLDPELMATLWGLRQKLVTEGGGTAAESVVADLAVTSYYNTLRIQRWIGDLAIAIEREFFGQEGPSARFEERHGRVEGLVVETELERLGEELLPLLERANRMMLRNVKALADLRRAPAPSVAINQAGQVNLGNGAQVNVERDAAPHEGATSVDSAARVRSSSSEH